jgi:hypothetical protein
MSRVSTIRQLFGNGPASDCAMDAREYVRGGDPKNPGRFSKGGGVSSGSKAAPAKPAPKKDASAQAHAAAKAKAAENAAKPKKPAKAKKAPAKVEGSAPTAKPKAEKQPKVTNPDVSAAKRAATALRKFEAGMEGKSASEIRKLEAQHIELLSKANATAKKAGVPTDAFEKKTNVGKAAKSKTSDVPPKPKVTQTEGGKEEARMRSAFSTIGAAAKAIPQKLDDAKSYSPEWRLLLQAVRNMEASPQLGAQGMESIRKASRGIKPVAAGEHAASERNALLAALKETKASPKAEKKPKAAKPKSEASAAKAAPKPKAPKKSTAHADLGSAFAAVPKRRRGGANPDHAS